MQDSATLEFEKVLVLCTTHIPKYAADLLDADDGCADYPIVRLKWAYGWMVHTGAYLENSVPVELRAVLRFAKDRDCDWVRLDRDAATIEALPTWDW